MPEDFNTLIDQHLQNDMLPKRGSIIETEVIQINSDFIVVNVGAKQEGFISRKEFKTLPKVGDLIKVFVESASPVQIKLSFFKAAKFENIHLLQEKMDKREPVEGTITKLTPNGFLVNVMEWESFLPFSQVMDFGALKEEDKKKFVNKKEQFIILKIEPRGDQQSIIVSRKQVFGSLKKENTIKFLETVELGSILKGTVVKINDKSVLIEVAENVAGLVTIGNISWDHINHPSSKLTLNDAVNVKVLDKNLEKGTLLLSIKNANENVWESFFQTHFVGTKVKGKIVSIKEHFMILWIQEGIKGILHRANISWAPLSEPLSKIYKVDQVIECQIITMDTEERRISLGIKQLAGDPWNDFENVHSLGDQVTGTIVKKTDFALFIDLGNHIQAMLHKNDLSWNMREQDLSRYQEGKSISCQISKIDVENHKVSCTLKSQDSNVWKTFGDRYQVDSLVKGKIVSDDSHGYMVLLDELVEAFLPFNQIPKEADLHIGDAVEVLITHFSAYKNMIKISMKAVRSKEQQEIVQNYNTSSSVDVKTPTLGDIFNFEQNKKK